MAPMMFDLLPGFRKDYMKEEVVNETAEKDKRILKTWTLKK